MLCETCKHTVKKYNDLSFGSIGYNFMCEECRGKTSAKSKIVFGEWKEISRDEYDTKTRETILVRTFKSMIGPRVYLNKNGTYEIAIPEIIMLAGKYYCIDIHLSKTKIKTKESAKLQADVACLEKGYKISGAPGV
jgi:hypothetical protein